MFPVARSIWSFTNARWGSMSQASSSLNQMKYIFLLCGSVTLQAVKRGWKNITQVVFPLFSLSSTPREGPWNQRRNPYSRNQCNARCTENSYVYENAKMDPPCFSTLSGPGGQFIWSAAVAVHSSVCLKLLTKLWWHSSLEDNPWRSCFRLS